MYVKLKKKFGQNFLIDKNILLKIVNIFNLKNKNILEIGPGIGHLTDHLIEQQLNKITLIEIDVDFIPVLKKKYSSNKKLTIINDDILKFDLKNFHKNDIVISNLPYNISSQILVKIIDYNVFDRMILMFQKEFAERLISNNINNLNCLILSFYDIKKEFNISKNSFRPRPKIESSVLSFNKLKKPLVEICDIELFKKFKSMVFINKRKKLSTIFNKNKIIYIGLISLDLRAEQLKLIDFISLFKSLKSQLINKFC